MTKYFIMFLLVLLSPLLSLSQTTTTLSDSKTQTLSGYVELTNHVPYYYELTPSQDGKPVFVLVNGLVYDLDRWTSLKNGLVKKGFGVLNFYMRGQYLTLREENRRLGEPAFFKTGITTQELAVDMNDLLHALHLDQRKVVVVGLSYGSSVAAEFAENHPEQVEQLIMMAPMTLPLDRYTSQGQWIYWNLEALKFWYGPFWGSQFYDYAYNMIYQSYLKQRIVPERVPDVLKDTPELHKEAIFHLVRASRDFDLRKYKFAGLCQNCVHFMLAKEEEEQMFKDQITAFEGLDKTSQGSLIYIPEASHAIPDSEPEAAAYLLEALYWTQNGKSVGIAPGQKYQLKKGQLSPMN